MPRKDPVVASRAWYQRVRPHHHHISGLDAQTALNDAMAMLLAKYKAKPTDPTASSRCALRNTAPLLPRHTPNGQEERGTSLALYQILKPECLKYFAALMSEDNSISLHFQRELLTDLEHRMMCVFFKCWGELEKMCVKPISPSGLNSNHKACCGQEVVS